MRLEPHQRLRGETRGLLDGTIVVPAVEGANPTVGEHDVRIKDLTSDGVRAARPDGGGNIVVQPAHEVEAHILRILVHVRARHFILLVDLDGAVDTDALEGVVPLEDPFLHIAAIAHGNRVLDVVDDRFLRRRERKLRVALLEIPAVDVARGVGLGAVQAEINVAREEVADAVIRDTRLVAPALGQRRDRVVHHLEVTALVGRFDGDLKVLWEALGLGEFRESSVESDANELLRLTNEHRIEVDDGLTVWSRRNDRHFEHDGVGEDSAHRILRSLLTRRALIQLRRDQREAIAVLAPEDILLRPLQTAEDHAARGSRGDEELHLVPAARELGEHLLFFAIHIEPEERVAIGSAHDALVVLRHLRKRRKVSRG